MLTASEKKCLSLTLAFLAAGAGLKFWNHRSVTIGPLASQSLASAAGEGAALADSAKDEPIRANDPAQENPQPAASDSRGATPEASATPPSPEPSAGREGSPRHPRNAVRKSGPAGKVPLNRARLSDLVGVPGIGEKTAEAIMAYRHSHGAFKGVGELLNVKGIGEKKLEKMRSFLVISPMEDSDNPGSLSQASMSESIHR